MRKKKQHKETTDKQYLDRLQRDSWNLELIISGLALFGLIALYDKFGDLGKVSEITGDSFVGGVIMTGVAIIYFSATIVFVNLIFHLLLRGLWIGAIGLRSVSGDINFYQLRFARPFNQFLRRRIPSFDDYIIKLDRICSVIFSFSFMLALLLIGFIAYWIVFSGLIYLGRLLDGADHGMFLQYAGIFFIVLYILLGLVYLVDFLTLGYLKRKRWLSRFYYPIYRFFGFITLARLYRPLYYNFIDDRLGRKMVILALPYILLLFIGLSLSFTGGAYYDKDFFSEADDYSGAYVREQYYENLQDEASASTQAFLLAKDVVHQPVNKLSMYILHRYTKVIEYKYPDLPKLNETILISDFVVGFNSADRHSKIISEEANYLNVFRSLFEVRLNGRLLDMEDAVLFRDEDTPFPKLVKYLSLSGEKPGLQQLDITYYSYSDRNDTLISNQQGIPFYYQPENN
jgi:hypothetical protein